MNRVLNLPAREHRSSVLDAFLASRPGAVQRVGQSPAPVAPQAATVTGADSAMFTTWGGIEWSDWMRGGLTGTMHVNESTARSVSAVVACINLIGGSIASLPLHMYRRTPDGRERVKTGQPDALWWLLNERPHPDWSAAAWWQFMSDSRLLHGDAFALIHRRAPEGLPGATMPEAFEPWHPLCVDVVRVEGRLLYTFHPMDGKGAPRTVEADDVLHIPGPGFDGKRSLSQLRYALMYPAGIASAADSQAAQVMADGARPDFAIEVPGQMNNEQQNQLRDKWLQRHSGQGAKKAPVILSGGLKLHQLTMSMQDAQLLTTRSFQIQEICRIFGVPPHMVGHTEATTSWGAGIEQQSLGFVTYTLQRHLVAFEQELNHKLFKTARLFCEFLTAGLLRGDTKSRFEAYRIALGRAGEPAWMRPSEVRKLENLPADEALDDPPGADMPGAPNPDPAADPAPAEGTPEPTP